MRKRWNEWGRHGMKGKAEKGDDQPAVLASVGGRQSANTTLKVKEGEVSQSGQTEVGREAFTRTGLRERGLRERKASLLD